MEETKKGEGLRSAGCSFEWAVSASPEKGASEQSHEGGAGVSPLGVGE